MSLQRIWKTFFDPQTIIPFLIGSVAMGMVSNGLYSAVAKAIGEDQPIVHLRIAIASMLILALAVIFARWRLSPRGREELNKSKPEAHRGLVLLVSQPVACRTAIQHHLLKLERVVLICSPQTRSMAEDLQREFPLLTTEIMTADDVLDPKLIYDLVRKAYSKLPKDFPAEEMISDYTGMTAHASVGMVLACMERDWPLEFTPALLDENRKPIGSLPPIEIGLSYKPNSPGARSVVVAVNAPAPPRSSSSQS